MIRFDRHNDVSYCYAIMTRTTIMLPETLRREIKERARVIGVSFGEYIRRAMEMTVLKPLESRGLRERQTWWKQMQEISAKTSNVEMSDGSENHDLYLTKWTKEDKFP